MASEKIIIAKLEHETSKRYGLAQLHYLISEREKLDANVFAQHGWKHSEYKDLLYKMFEQEDIAPKLLERYFEDYKKDWGVAKRRLFDSTEGIPYEDFLKDFGEFISWDIKDSIKKTKSTDLSDLKLKDSIKIIEKYFEVRKWINNRINELQEEHQLTDKEIMLMLDKGEMKYEWYGNVDELVGLLTVLEEKKWLHIPFGQSRGKASLLLSCFKFHKAKGTEESVKKIYDANDRQPKTLPFEKIAQR